MARPIRTGGTGRAGAVTSGSAPIRGGTAARVLGINAPVIGVSAVIHVMAAWAGEAARIRC
jgi:hypothetical protein